MKKTILLFITLFMFAIPAFSQKTHREHRDKGCETKRQEMMEFKLKFLADEMDLNEEQRIKFDEVYTQMEQERRAAYKKIKKAEKEISDNNNATESDYEKATAEISAAREEMALLEKKYDEKLNNFLTKKQLYKLKEAENKFWKTSQNCRDKKLKEKR